MGKNNITSYGDLKDVLDTLSPQELKQPVKFWGENVSGVVTKIECLEEDYINPSGTSCEPISSYKDDPAYDEEDIVLEKGSLILTAEMQEEFPISAKPR